MALESDFVPGFERVHSNLNQRPSMRSMQALLVAVAPVLIQ